MVISNGEINIIGEMEGTGGVRLNNNRQKLRTRFDIVRKLGQGTYGKVQLAVNKDTGEEVAIKTIKKAKIESEQDLVRIQREIQIMSSVQHPHIIHIYEVFENKEKIVLVMEYANGGELYDYLSYKKVLGECEARRLFRQIVSAVYYCHKNKICHRDLKLENILLDQQGNAKIADFGLSNVFDEKRMLTTFCGSPLYASPEIVKGTPYYGPEVDCWSLGVLLYTLVYGAMPFDGSNFRRLVKQISEGDYYEPKKPSEASALIRRMLTVLTVKRATIEDICNDWWVNQGYQEPLQDVAEEMCHAMPVRLDYLLSLATQKAPPDNAESKTEESKVAKPEDLETTLLTDSNAMNQSIPSASENLNIQGEPATPQTELSAPINSDMISTEQSDVGKIPQLMEIQQSEDTSQLSTRKHKLNVSEKSLVTDSAERIGSIKKKKRKEESHEEKPKLKDNKSIVTEESKAVDIATDSNKLPDNNTVPEEVSTTCQSLTEKVTSVADNKTSVSNECDSLAAESTADKLSPVDSDKAVDSNAKELPVDSKAKELPNDSPSNNKTADNFQTNDKPVLIPPTSGINDKKKLTDLPPSSSQFGRKSSIALTDTNKKEGASPSSRKTSLTNAANFKQITDSISRKGSIGPSDSSKISGLMSMFGGRKGSIGNADTSKLPPLTGPGSRKNSVTKESQLEKQGSSIEPNKDASKSMPNKLENKNNKNVSEISIDTSNEEKRTTTAVPESEKTSFLSKRRESVKDSAKSPKINESDSSSSDAGNKNQSSKSNLSDKQRKGSVTDETKGPDVDLKNSAAAGRRKSSLGPNMNKMEVDESSSGTDTNRSEDEEGKKMKTNLSRKDSLSQSEDSSSYSPQTLSPTSSKVEAKQTLEKKENKKKVAVPQAFSKVSEARKAFEVKPPEKRSLVIPGMKVCAARKTFEASPGDKSSKLPKPKTDLFSRRSSTDTGKSHDNDNMKEPPSPTKVVGKRMSVPELEQPVLLNKPSENKELPFNQTTVQNSGGTLNDDKIISSQQSRIPLTNVNKEKSSNETSLILSAEGSTNISDSEKATKLPTADASQKMTGFVPTLDVTMEVKPVGKEPFSKLGSATKSNLKNSNNDELLPASNVLPEADRDNEDQSPRQNNYLLSKENESLFQSAESSIASSTTGSKLPMNESKSSFLDVTGDEYSPFSSASTLVPSHPSPSPSVTSLCSIPSPIPPVSEVKVTPSKDICGSETSFLARAFMHQHEKGSVSPPVAKNSPTPSLREQSASPVTKDNPVLILIKETNPSVPEAESPKPKGTKISSVEIKLNPSESPTSTKASKNIDKPLQQMVPEAQPNVQHASPGTFTLLGVKSEVSFNVEAVPPADEPPTSVTTTYYSMPPLATNLKSAKPPAVIKSSDEKPASSSKTNKKSVVSIPSTPPPTMPPSTTSSLPCTPSKLQDQPIDIRKVEEMPKTVQDQSLSQNTAENENSTMIAHPAVSSEVMTKKPKERIIPIQLEESPSPISTQKSVEEKLSSERKSFRSSRLKSGNEGWNERGTSFSSDSGPGSPVDSTPFERGSQKSDDEQQKGYGVYRSKFRSIHKAFLNDERRESSLERSESFSSTGSTDDLEDIFDSFTSENLLSNLLNRTRTIIEQLTHDDSTRRFGSVFGRMPLMGSSLSGFRSSFARSDPFSRRDPFGRNEPSTSFRSDHFGKSDSFGKTDSFGKSDSFGSYCADSGMGSSRFSRSTSRQNSEPNNNSFSSRNSWRSSRSQFPEKSETDNYMSDSTAGSPRRSRDTSTYSRMSSRDDESALSDTCSTRSSFSSNRRSLFNYSRSVSTSISEEDIQSTTSTSNQTGSTRRFSERSSSSREEDSTTSRFSRSRDSSTTREGSSSRRESSLNRFARLSSRFHSDDFFGGSRDCLDSDFQDDFPSGTHDRRSYNRSLSSEYARDNGFGSMRRRHSLRSLFDMTNEKSSEKSEEVLVQRQEETRRRESQSRFLNRRSMRYDNDDVSIYGTIRRHPGHYLNYSKSLSKEISGRDSDEEILGIHRPRSILVLADPDVEDASATDNEDSSSATDLSNTHDSYHDSYDDTSRRGGGSAGGRTGGGSNGGGGGGGGRSSRSSYSGSRSFRSSHGSSYGKGNQESDISGSKNIKASRSTENSSSVNSNCYSSEFKQKTASDKEQSSECNSTNKQPSNSENLQPSDDVGKKTSNLPYESKSTNQTTPLSSSLKQEVPSKLNVKPENLKKNHLLYHQSGTKNSGNPVSQTKKDKNSPRNSQYDSYQVRKTLSGTNQSETTNSIPNSEPVITSNIDTSTENSKLMHNNHTKYGETSISNGRSTKKQSLTEGQKTENNLEANNEPSTSTPKKYDEKWVGSVGKAAGSSRFKSRRFGTNKELSKSEDALNKVGDSDTADILENKLAKQNDKGNSSRIPRNILKFTRSISSELDRLQEDLNAVGSKANQNQKYRKSVSVDESAANFRTRNFLNSKNVNEVVEELKKLEEDILNLSTNTYPKTSPSTETEGSKTTTVKQNEESGSLNVKSLKKNLLQNSLPSTPVNGNNSNDNLSTMSDGYDSANPSDFEDSSSVCSDYGGALEEESVSERIRRKSYFARFQDNRNSRKSRKSLDLDGTKSYRNHKRHDDYLSSSVISPRSNLSSASFRHEESIPTVRPRRSCSRTRESSLDDPLMTSSLGRRTSFGSRSHLNSSREVLMNGDIHSEKPESYSRSKSLATDSDVDSDCDRPASRASQMLEEALEGLDGMSVLSNVTSPTSFSKPFSRTHSLPDADTDNQPYKSYIRQCSTRSDSPTRSCYSSGTPTRMPQQSRLSYNDEMNSSPVLGWSGYEHRRLRPSSLAVTNNSSTPIHSSLRSRHDYLLNRHVGGYEEPVMERPFSPPSSRLPSLFDAQRSSDLRRYSAILDSSSPREVLRKALDICNSSQY